LLQVPLEKIPKVRAVSLPRFDGTPVQRLINGMRALVQLTRQIVSADFVYLFWPGRISLIAAGLCRCFRKPYGIYFRGEQLEPSSSFAGAFGKARFIITAGERLREIASQHNADVENVTPMTAVRPEHIRHPCGRCHDSEWKLLYVGRLEERKGTTDLFKAAAYLVEWGLSFTLTLVGHSYDIAEALRSLPESVSKHLRLTGAVPNFESLIPFYCAADVFVLPSHDEGFPRVLYEAMALGVPIVTTFVGSIPTLMKDRENCLRIEPRNSIDIAEKIYQLVSDPDLKMRIAWSGHRCITELMNSWQRSHAVQIVERLRNYFDGELEPASGRN